MKSTRAAAALLSPIAQQVVARVLHAGRPLLSGPGHEAADGLVGQKLLHGGESLGERWGVVGPVYRTVAGTADGDGPVQHRVGDALLLVALVGAPAGKGLLREGDREGGSSTQEWCVRLFRSSGNTY